jgi:hypothetical protein
MSNKIQKKFESAINAQATAKTTPKTGFLLLIETLKEQHGLNDNYFEKIFFTATDGVLSGRTKPTTGMLKRFSDEFGLDFQQINNDYRLRVN